MCGNCGKDDHKFVDCPIQDLQFPLTKVDLEKLREDATSYQNWLKYVDNRGWTECFAGPEEIKQKFDKLNKEIESHKGTGLMLSKENQNLKRHYATLTKKNEELRDDIKQLQDYNKTFTKGLQEELVKNSQLKKQNDNLIQLRAEDADVEHKMKVEILTLKEKLKEK